jgi:hypothetical protein
LNKSPAAGVHIEFMSVPLWAKAEDGRTMRLGVLAAMVCAALMAGTAPEPVSAQFKIRILPPPIFFKKIPRMNKRQKMPPIPPSQALSIAGRMVPNGKPVGVKLLNNNKYVVTVRRGNTVTRVIVDGETGQAK